MKKIVGFLITSALLTLTISVLVQGGPPAKDLPVTSTIQDFDAATNLAYRIKSDSLGTYKNGINAVVSIIQGIGDWELDTKSSTVRKVFIDFGDPVLNSTQTPNAPFSSATVPLRFISKCTQLGIDTRNIGLNQTVLCPLAISLSYGGSTYAVRMNPANYTETEWAQWTCLSLNSSGKCNSWQLEPSVVQIDGQRKIKAQLIKVAATNRETDQLRGLFYMSFKINVTNP